MQIKNIWIYGIGGVGGFIGGKITHAVESKKLPYQVSFIARGSHLAEIQNHGLILNTPEKQGLICKPAFAVSQPEKLPVPDVVFVCVKSYDLEDVSKTLDNLVLPYTVIIPLLNGIDIYSQMRKFLKKGILLPSCIYIGTHIEKPGTVTQKGGEGKILTGFDPKYLDFNPADLFYLFEQAELKYQWFDNSQSAIWEKYMFIAPFGLATAAYQKTIGEVLSNPELKQVVTSIMKEIYEISLKKNVSLPQNIIETTLIKASQFSPETKTSFQRDLEISGKPNESNLFSKTIINLGKEFKVKTSATDKIDLVLEKRMR